VTGPDGERGAPLPPRGAAPAVLATPAHAARLARAAARGERSTGAEALPRSAPVGVVATVLLHPRHVVLAGLVGGLLAGPRSGAVVAALAAAGLAAGAAARDVTRVPFRRRVRGERTATVVELPVPVPAPLLGALVVLAVVAGAVGAVERRRALDRTALAPAAAATLRGHVADAPRTRARGVRIAPLVLADGPAAGERVLVRVPARLAWPARGGRDAAIGDEVVVRGRLRALERHEAFERRRGVHAVVEARALRATGRDRGSPLDAARERAERGLQAGHAPEAAALARGMVLGQDAALPADLRDAFRAAGLAHLLAASGQNVMLLAALVLGAGAVLGLDRRARLALALVAVAAYVPLAGAGPSIQRAGVMGAAGLVAALAGRPASRGYAVLLAATATLALDPRAAEDPGWQLSFAAVIAILALHARLRAALVRRRVPGAAADAAALTVAATLGTAPLLALHFEEVSLVSLPANLLAAPAVAPVMWLGTLAALLGGPPAELLNAVAALPLGFLAWLGRAAAAVPGASVGAALPGPLATAATYALIAVAIAARHRIAGLIVRPAAEGPGEQEEPLAGVAYRPRRAGAVVGAVALAAVALVLVTRPVVPAAPGEPALSLLDVGQGDAVLLQDGPRAILVDTGPPGSNLLGELRRLGVRRLDAVVVTHSSADHEGGLAAVLAALPVGLVLDGRQTAAEQGAAPRFAGLARGQARAVPEAGQVVRAGPRLALEVLWPPPGRSRAGDPNRTPVVALARAGELTALLTADAESAVTLPLDPPRVDVLKVAHHGSADAGLPRLLDRVRPAVALVPVGRNTYGHPTPDTLAALRAVPDVRRTDRDGTATVTAGDLARERAAPSG
jgi:competence protein ComEC